MIHDPAIASTLAVLGGLLGGSSVTLWLTRHLPFWARAEQQLRRRVRTAAVRHARAR